MSGTNSSLKRFVRNKDYLSTGTPTGHTKIKFNGMGNPSVDDCTGEDIAISISVLLRSRKQSGVMPFFNDNHSDLDWFSSDCSCSLTNPIQFNFKDIRKLSF